MPLRFVWFWVWGVLVRETAFFLSVRPGHLVSCSPRPGSIAKGRTLTTGCCRSGRQSRRSPWLLLLVVFLRAPLAPLCLRCCLLRARGPLLECVVCVAHLVCCVLLLLVEIVLVVCVDCGLVGLFIEKQVSPSSNTGRHKVREANVFARRRASTRMQRRPSILLVRPRASRAH